MIEILHNLSYQDKINIYDTKCKGCGYALIMAGEIEVRSIEEAIDIAQHTGDEIDRSCSYPPDVDEQYGEPVYPSLNEIVTNGCRFWYSKNIEDGKCATEELS